MFNYKKGNILEVVHESFLAIKRKEGLIIILACKHPKLEQICEHAKRITGYNKIVAIIGGLSSSTKKRIEYLNRTNAEIYAIHCSHFKGGEVLNLKKLPLVIE